MLDCIVRNATNTGARVQIANTVEVPEGLKLDGGYWVRPCRVVWRTLTETGVEFLKTGVDSARSWRRPPNQDQRTRPVLVVTKPRNFPQLSPKCDAWHSYVGPSQGIAAPARRPLSFSMT